MIVPLVFWIFIFVLVLPIGSLIVIPLAILRLCVNIVAYFKRPDLVASLDSRDLVFTGDDYYGKARKSVISSIVMNGPVSLETLKDKFTKNVLDKPHYFKLHCRPFRFLGYWFWQRVEIQNQEFKDMGAPTTTNYVEVWRSWSPFFEHSCATSFKWSSNDLTTIYENMDKQFLEAEETYTEEELNLVLPDWVSQGYSPGTPLWEMKLVKLSGNRSALIVKIHHMVGDGVSFMNLLGEFSDHGWTNLKTPGTKSFSFAHWAYAWYNFPWTAFKAFRLAKIRKGFRPKAIGGPAFTSYTCFPMEKLRVVRRVSKCLFPSVLAGLLSRSFYKLLQSTGKTDIPTSIRIVIPTPWHNRPEQGTCNHVGWLHSEMPLGDPEAITLFETSVKRSYISGLHGIMWQIFRGMYLLPSPSLSVYTDWGEKNLPPAVLTSIPGSVTPVVLLGQEVDHCYPTLSLGHTSGCNACMTTYVDGGYFSMRVSREIIPTKELLDQLVGKCMHDELELLYQDALNKENGNAMDHVQIKMS